MKAVNSVSAGGQTRGPLGGEANTEHHKGPSWLSCSWLRKPFIISTEANGLVFYHHSLSKQASFPCTGRDSPGCEEEELPQGKHPV